MRPLTFSATRAWQVHYRTDQTFEQAETEAKRKQIEAHEWMKKQAILDNSRCGAVYFEFNAQKGFRYVAYTGKDLGKRLERALNNTYLHWYNPDQGIDQ